MDKARGFWGRTPKAVQSPLSSRLRRCLTFVSYNQLLAGRVQYPHTNFLCPNLKDTNNELEKTEGMSVLVSPTTRTLIIHVLQSSLYSNSQVFFSYPCCFCPCMYWSCQFSYTGKSFLLVMILPPSAINNNLIIVIRKKVALYTHCQLC